MDFATGKSDIILTRSIFLRGIGLIYLFAFVSIYVQIQGLYGDEGLLPVKQFMDQIKSQYSEISYVLYPNILLFSENINSFILKAFVEYKENLFSAEENTLHLICLIGIATSLLIVLNSSIFMNIIGFIICWITYLTVFLSGQLFMSFQWDTFLLEAGFLAILFAPLSKGNLRYLSSIDIVVYYLIRFLMFRFIFSSGVVKITSNCPQWSKLTALNHHFKSQPLHNLISLFAHNFNDTAKKAMVALHFVIEVDIY